MITTIKIGTINEVMRLLNDAKYNSCINRYRSPYFYRGIPDDSYKLVTSLKRNCKTKQNELEKYILKQFTKYAAMYDAHLEQSIWYQMIIGQHYGLPTRLLDWTHSPLVGLHFATIEGNLDNLDKSDCLLWKIDANELKMLLPDKYKKHIMVDGLFVMTTSMLKGITNNLDEYDADMNGAAMIILEPPSIDQRIINQYSFFSVVPNNMEDIERFLDKSTNNTVKYIIDKKIRWQLRDILDHLNMSERMIYPGLDGVAKWLTRHYFVNDL